MAFIFGGNPLTGTGDDDYIIDYPGSTPNNTLTGLGGNDLMLADWDFFFSTFGQSAGTAENITSNSSPWSTYNNNEILNSTTIPHTSVLFMADSATQAYYSVAAGAGQTITLDVDFGGPSTDTIVEIYAADGITLLASNDDNAADIGSPGGLDSFLQYTFSTTATYIIRVKEFGDDNNFEAGDHFVLNVSLEGQAVTNDDPVSGDDTLVGGTGLDRLSGGGGNDTFEVVAGDVVAGEYYNGGSGNDTLIGSGAGGYDFDFTNATVVSIETINYVDPGEDEDGTFRFSASQIGTGIASNATINFSGFNDVTDTFQVQTLDATSVNLSAMNFGSVDSVSDSVRIIGDASNENITGSQQNDTIFGNAGNDTLNGGAGADTMTGGVGDDAYIVAAAGDITIENAGEGTDTVFSYINWTLGANIERLDLEGGATNATGNGLNNTLVGNSLNNVLNGAGGNDYMRGGAGNDIYIVAAAGDATAEDPGQGTDTVRSYINWTLANNVERLELQSSGNINGTGNTLANTLVGNSGNNVLSGGNGNDYISAGAGNDTLNGGAGNDTLIGAAGRDALNGGAGNDVFDFDLVSHSPAGPATRDSIVGGFSHGSDDINLATIDANTLAGGNQAFSFIGGAAFTGVAGQLRYTNYSGTVIIDADVNGDSAADMQILVAGTTWMTGTDFIL